MKAAAYIGGPASLSALMNDPQKITAMQVYVDGVLKLADNGTYIADAAVEVPQGKHRISVKGWNVKGQQYLAASYVTVSGTTSTQPRVTREF